MTVIRQAVALLQPGRIVTLGLVKHGKAWIQSKETAKYNLVWNAAQYLSTALPDVVRVVSDSQLSLEGIQQHFHHIRPIQMLCCSHGQRENLTVCHYTGSNQNRILVLNSHIQYDSRTYNGLNCSAKLMGIQIPLYPYLRHRTSI